MANQVGVNDKTAALDALRALAPEVVGSSLIEALRVNDSARIRAWAADRLRDQRALLSTEDRERAAELLAGRVAEGRANAVGEEDKTAALKALQAIAPDRVGAALAAACREKGSARVRAWAAGSLRDLKEQLSAADRAAAAAALAERVTDDQPETIGTGDKTAALAALRVLAPDQAEAALEQAKKSSNASVLKWAESQR